MAFNVNETPKSTGKFKEELIDEGLYPARLARIIELGTQEDRYGEKDRVVFAFTIPSQKIEIDGEQKQKMMMTFPLNQTSNPDSTLAKYVKALGGATWEDIIGKPCMIEITHKEVKGETKMNITNVVKPMAGLDVEEPDCDVFVFDFENPRKEVFEKLSDFRKDQIKNATNYQGSKVQQMLEGNTGYDAEASGADSGDDRPF